MSSNLVQITKAMVMFADIVNTFDAANKTRAPSNTPVLDNMQLMNRIFILGCTFAQAGREIYGDSAKNLAMQKNVELFPRIAELGLRFTKEVYLLREAENKEVNSIKRNIQFLEKGLIAPASDVVRVFAEASAYQQQSLLELSPEEFAKEIAPLNKEIAPLNKEIAPLNKEECIESKATYEKVALVSSLLRASSEFGFINQAANATHDVYLELALYFRAMNRFPDKLPDTANEAIGGPMSPDTASEAIGGPVSPDTASEAIGGPVSPDTASEAIGGPVSPDTASEAIGRPVRIGTQPSLEDLETIDFKDLPAVPAPLHKDSLFKKYICPLTGAPVREPVGDPNNNQVVYDKNAIEDWVFLNERAETPVISPIINEPISATNNSISKETLVEKPALKLAIEHRLAFYQENFRQWLEGHPGFQKKSAAAVNPTLQANVDQENPNV
jgi:hypothetical protein